MNIPFTGKTLPVNNNPGIYPATYIFNEKDNNMNE